MSNGQIDVDDWSSADLRVRLVTGESCDNGVTSSN